MPNRRFGEKTKKNGSRDTITMHAGSTMDTMMGMTSGATHDTMSTASMMAGGQDQGTAMQDTARVGMMGATTAGYHGQTGARRDSAATMMGSGRSMMGGH